MMLSSEEKESSHSQLVNELKVSERFCADDSDITICSSDNVLFKVHRKNLELHSDVFGGANEFPSRIDEVVELSETSAVLELLFQFMYRQPQPHLATIEFELRWPLAEAAEKYRVFSATQVCNIYMRASSLEHPVEVLDYAATHGYSDLCDEVAPKTVGVPLALASVSFSQHNLLRWMKYREEWVRVLKAAFQGPPVLLHALHRGGFAECENWEKFQWKILSGLGPYPERLQKLKEIFEDEKQLIIKCLPCRTRADHWEKLLLAEITDIPLF